MTLIIVTLYIKFGANRNYFKERGTQGQCEPQKTPPTKQTVHEHKNAHMNTHRHK